MYTIQIKTYLTGYYVSCFFIIISTDEVKDDTKPQSHPSQQVSLKLSTIELITLLAQTKQIACKYLNKFSPVHKGEKKKKNLNNKK